MVGEAVLPFPDGDRPFPIFLTEMCLTDRHEGKFGRDIRPSGHEWKPDYRETCPSFFTFSLEIPVGQMEHQSEIFPRDTPSVPSPTLLRSSLRKSPLHYPSQLQLLPLEGGEEFAFVPAAQGDEFAEGN